MSSHNQQKLRDRYLSILPTKGSRPELQVLYDAVRDYPCRNGKGIRGELLIQCASVYSRETPSYAWENSLWLASGIELFQNWVLIHDDIMDDSEQRRGYKTLHRIYGIPIAINVGDALHAYMWEAVNRASVPGAIEEFLHMIHRTAEGQHLDLHWVEHHDWNLTEADYLEMVRLKTAYYTVISPLRLGALAAGVKPNADFTPAGLALGEAFQIRDDVLNLTGDPAKYGKEIGGDLLEGKRTLIVLHWLAHAPAEQKHVFLDQMRRPRPEKSLEVIQDIHRWLLESGSVQYAQQYADTQAKKGLSLLSDAFKDVQNPQAAQELIGAMQKLATREA